MGRSEDYDFSASNEMLLELCKLQDQEALRVLFRRHEKPVYNLLYRMLSNHEDAEEALADVFVKVWRGAGSFKGESKFTTWLFKIAANTARDFLRARMVRREVSLEDGSVSEGEVARSAAAKSIDPEDCTVREDELNRITAALDGLSEDDRLLVTLYHFQGLDYQDISEITGISANNLKVKLFRARQRLKKLCEELDGGCVENELRRSTTDSSGLRQGACEWS
ncbi:MAG: RNA polymerase sigma factor [Armatimonadota bacterium]|nr:RNA polymerase sigma factor [Armatimonadota bacterium]